MEFRIVSLEKLSIPSPHVRAARRLRRVDGGLDAVRDRPLKE
jgi:hypothetical protein